MCKTLNQCSEHTHKARHGSAHLRSQRWGSRDRKMGERGGSHQDSQSVTSGFSETPSSKNTMEVIKKDNWCQSQPLASECTCACTHTHTYTWSWKSIYTYTHTLHIHHIYHPHSHRYMVHTHTHVHKYCPHMHTHGAGVPRLCFWVSQPQHCAHSCTWHTHIVHHARKCTPWLSRRNVSRASIHTCRIQREWTVFNYCFSLGELMIKNLLELTSTMHY